MGLRIFAIFLTIWSTSTHAACEDNLLGEAGLDALAQFAGSVSVPLAASDMRIKMEEITREAESVQFGSKTSPEAAQVAEAIAYVADHIVEVSPITNEFVFKFKLQFIEYPAYTNPLLNLKSGESQDRLAYQLAQELLHLGEQLLTKFPSTRL